MNILGLIGFPLEHSFSPEYFSHKFARAGISDFEYRLFPLKDLKELPQLLVNVPNLLGFNVTIPYKEAIIPHLDNLTEEALEIGAVNTVAVHRKGNKLFLTGHNTDAPAFEETIQDLIKMQPRRTLILGSGGASKAVNYALSKLSIEYDLVGRVKREGIRYTYNELTPHILSQYTLIVNCTPLGMHPDTESFPPIPYEGLSSNHVLYDLVYNPHETLFLKKGKFHGAFTINGLRMLFRQADLAWEFWKKTLKLPE
ncbi:MAG: shikimate dehydrogenase [Bacteroidales bacterium]|jgi:shikimate dehydrogenase|nr:shikimate dehydrogenase [Bacteroidales bacterium]MDN5330200.1 shikimate dehydrogenase [Bacteroidales bacterium]